MPINSLEDLVYALLNEIGLGITPEGFLYDPDTNQVLQFGGKQIRTSINKASPAISTDLYAAFDPIFDNRFMGMMLGYYLHKEECNGNISPLSIFETIQETKPYETDDHIHSKKTFATVVCEGGYRYTSCSYYQKGLKYSDIILRIGGNPYCDLTKFDSIPEEAIVEAFR